MAVITYTDSFGRANVTKLSHDTDLWNGVVDGACLSIRSDKLLTTWQDILDGMHNADIAQCSPVSMPVADEAFYSERQSGSLTFDSSVRVSMDATDPALTAYTDSFNRANGSVGANWTVQAPGGTFTFTVLSNQMRFLESFLGTVGAYAVSTQLSAHLNQYSQIKYKSGTPAKVGPSVRHQGTGASSPWYALEITATTWQIVRHNDTNSGSLITNGSFTLSANDVIKLTAVDDATGVQLTAYQNGVSLGTAHVLFASGDYLGTGIPGVGKGTTTGAMDCSFDEWQAGQIASPAANASSVSTEIQFYNENGGPGGYYGVGYSEEEDSPSSHTYTPKVYVFTDTDYQDTAITLVHGDVLSGEVEIVDSLTCNVIAKVNGVEAVRIDGAARAYGRPAIRGAGNSPEQEHYIDGLQPRAEQVWSQATLLVETLVPVVSETDRTSIAACVRTPKQAAWGKWKFSGTLRAYSVMDNTLVLSIQRGDTVFVETIDISPVPGTRFLDCEQVSAYMETPTLDTGVTTWRLFFDITDDPNYPLTVINTTTGEPITTLPRTYSNKISAVGDFTSTPVAIGLLYPTQWELSTLFVTTQGEQGETIALTDGHLQIRHVEFNYSATGAFTVTVIPNTEDPSQSYEYAFDGTSDAKSGTFRAPVLGQNSKARITVGGTSHRPFAISNFSWTGYISQLTKRV